MAGVRLFLLYMHTTHRQYSVKLVGQLYSSAAAAITAELAAAVVAVRPLTPILIWIFSVAKRPKIHSAAGQMADDDDAGFADADGNDADERAFPPNFTFDTICGQRHSLQIEKNYWLISREIQRSNWGWELKKTEENVAKEKPWMCYWWHRKIHNNHRPRNKNLSQLWKYLELLKPRTGNIRKFLSCVILFVNMFLSHRSAVLHRNLAKCFTPTL